MSRGAARAAIAFVLGGLTVFGLQAALSPSERQVAKLAPADVAPPKSHSAPRSSASPLDPAIAPEPVAQRRASPAPKVPRRSARPANSEHASAVTETAQSGAAMSGGPAANASSEALSAERPPTEAQREVEAQAEFEARAELESHGELELREEPLASGLDLPDRDPVRPDAPHPQPILDPAYPLPGVALSPLTQVYAEPAEKPIVVGYFRRGAQVQAGPLLPGPGCQVGWHAVQGGGYVCEGRSFALLSERAAELSPLPAAPDLNGPLPYAYVKISARDLPLFAHTPSPDEEKSVLAAINAAKAKGGPDLVAIRALGLVDPRDPPARALQSVKPGTPVAKSSAAKPATPPKAPAGKVVQPKVAPIKNAQLARTAAKPTPVVAKGVNAKASPQPAKPLPPPPAARLLPEVARGLLQPGYYVSLDAASQPPPPNTDKDSVVASFLRTVRGDILRSSGETWVKASELHGEAIQPGSSGQLALIFQRNQFGLRRDEANGQLKKAEPLTMLQAVWLTDEAVRKGGREYRATADGLFVPVDALRFIPPQARPPFVPASARYISIQLSTQTLVAYDAGTPIYATLISSGKPEHATPTGIFRIQHKHVSTTMDAEASGEQDSYSIEDVPWTMYFSGSLALHAAFWHEGFGRTHSHGCVNLAPRDAKWLFDWVGPNLPPNFHGVVATRENPGTFVVINP